MQISEMDFMRLVNCPDLWFQFVQAVDNAGRGIDPRTNVHEETKNAREKFAERMNKRYNGEVVDLTEEDYTIIDEKKELELKQVGVRK